MPNSLKPIHDIWNQHASAERPFARPQRQDFDCAGVCLTALETFLDIDHILTIIQKNNTHIANLIYHWKI
ncbi:Methionyl-tRNA formyltransferase [Trichinella spiralis]|uniref:Methionyl-tRNA formyltransferase n=1 Tax=Trichinella spiralis TaxID=6334 RepID=A0ABR3K5L6_TRISP